MCFYCANFMRVLARWASQGAASARWAISAWSSYPHTPRYKYTHTLTVKDRHLAPAIILGTHLVAAFSGTLRSQRQRRRSSFLGHFHSGFPAATLCQSFRPPLDLQPSGSNCHLPTWLAVWLALLGFCLIKVFGAHVFMPQMALLRQRILFFTATFRHLALSFLYVSYIYTYIYRSLYKKPLIGLVLAWVN